MKIKQHMKLALALMAGAVLCLGCESGTDNYGTNALFIREPGELVRLAVPPDSIRVATPFNDDIEENSSMLVGRYAQAEGFCVIKFLRPSQSDIDSLNEVTLNMSVGNIWTQGISEFELYAVNSDWADTAAISPDMFYPLDEPIALHVSDPDSLSGLSFPIPIDIIDSWTTYGTFLVRASDAGMTMVSISAEHSSAPAYFDFISRGTNGVIDTSTVRCYQDSYYFDTGFPAADNSISDGNASGFILDVELPSELPIPTAVNKVLMTVGLGDHLIARTDGMPIAIYRLTEAFNADSVITTDLLSGITVTVNPAEPTMTLDITNFVYSWLSLGEPNYGIIFQPVYTSASPDYIELAPVDSLIVYHTKLPELEQ